MLFALFAIQAPEKDGEYLRGRPLGLPFQVLTTLQRQTLVLGIVYPSLSFVPRVGVRDVFLPICGLGVRGKGCVPSGVYYNMRCRQRW